MQLATLNTEIVKYVLLVVSAPLWWPFLKELYRELNDALRAEGGLFGRPPTALELRNMDRDQGRYESPLINEEYASQGQRQRPARDGAPAGRRSSSPQRGPGEGAAQPGYGFAKQREARGFSRKDPRRG